MKTKVFRFYSFGNFKNEDLIKIQEEIDSFMEEKEQVSFSHSETRNGTHHHLTIIIRYRVIVKD